MTKHKKVLALITAIRESFVGSEQVYTNGSCYKLYKILKTQFTEAQAICDDCHVYTKINNRYYDIYGEQNPDFSDEAYIVSMRKGDSAEEWIFNIYDIHIECPNCNELFLRAELEPEHINKTKKRYE